MHKLAALVIAAALGIAGMGYAKPAEARVYVGVGIGLPVVAYPPAVGVYAPYYYGRPYYPYYGYGRLGYGFRGYGYGFRGHGYARGLRR
jgi:hypothetical protein